MAEQEDVSVLFQGLTGELKGLSTTLKHHGVSQLVESFSGERQNFENWIKSIEKYAVLAEIALEKVKLIAYQSSKGSVSDFLSRHLADNPNCTWEQVKKELSNRYGPVVDVQYDLVLLQNARQSRYENVQMFAERLLDLAKKAYNAQEIILVPIQRQIVGCFITGIGNVQLKMKLMRENPATLLLCFCKELIYQQVEIVISRTR